MDQIFIFIIVAIIWAVRAWWTKQQEQAAVEEFNRREREEPKRMAPPPARPAYEQDQRYKDVQEEIRRRIAERMGKPVSTAAPAEPAQSAPSPSYKRSPSALPPIRPDLTPTLRRAKPTPQPSPPVARPQPVMTAPPPPAPVLAPSSAESVAYAAPAMAEAQAYPDEKQAFALPAESNNRASSLHVLLASTDSARQAFVLREIFDRPLCLRDAPGGLESWN